MSGSTLDAVSTLAADRAPQAEADRRLAPDVVAGITELNLFRAFVPEAAAGPETPPAELVAAVEALARGDASAGWVVAVTATSGLLGGYLSADSARTIYGEKDTIVGGVFAPRGKAIPSEGGYRVTGRWPFASGCRHADWFLVGCVIPTEDGVEMLPGGLAPDVRLVLAPIDDYVIDDTWHVAGLRATGSHDVELADVFIPAERTASVFTDRPLTGSALYAFPMFGLLAVAIAGVGLGIARGALDDLYALASVKTPTGSRRTVAERSVAQADTAKAEAALRAARGFLYQAIDDAYESAGNNNDIPADERAALRLAATHASESAATVVDTVWRLCGASVAYEKHPLQRRFRDMHVATQHMLVAPATWELAGRVLLGLPTDLAQL